jgi:3-deoxy-D-manno-octulosonic acid kinase
MQPIETQNGESHILYDAELPIHAEPALFEPAAWRRRGQFLGSAQGRGETAFVGDGSYEYVLRHYRRGGLPGRLVRDRYLWVGLERTRAWREWRLTAELYRLGLPVPRPVAARVEREGLLYSADLVTVRIPEARSLAQVLHDGPLPEAQWQAIGACIRRFHAAGVDHADLNAHNILLAGEEVFLIDFDRGRLRAPGRWQRHNLARLLRSLRKLYNESLDIAFTDADWHFLLAGYGDGNGQ